MGTATPTRHDLPPAAPIREPNEANLNAGAAVGVDAGQRDGTGRAIKTLCVCGARPNFMKIAPLARALEGAGRFDNHIVHTGQHYDLRMSELFIKQLGITQPDVNLEAGGGSHAEQTAQIMRRFEPVLLEQRPDWVIVVGDVNSTLACALVATKLGVRVAHVEAGLRSFDRSMPEEINRVLTDQISDLLLVSEPSGVENLRREGVADAKVHFVGNVMIDTLLAHRARANQSQILEELGLVPGGYVAVTLHRPSNVDDRDTAGEIVEALSLIGRELPVVFPAHPRTRQGFERFGLASRLTASGEVRMVEPLGYLDFLKLMADSAMTLTDSGGIQEETTILGVPCLTLRPNTERPITLEAGTNRLVGVTTEEIVSAFRNVRADPPQPYSPPPLWDGRAAERIVACLLTGHASQP
ncbi:MAG: non-hydrolyzing UDP-N-acetylglucosamine 2-epimerase [Phycisphaerae bacterium]